MREIPFGRPWITDRERDAVLRVLSGHILTHGPECKAFEQEFAAFVGSPDRPAHAITTSSCMAALHMSYLHLGIGEGDEVIVPAQTHTATVHAVEWVRARPVFVDCDPRTGNLSAEGIERAITSRTKAISVVHFVGIPCDMTAIMAVAERHNLKVIEDCAIALGARWKGIHVGLFGDVGCFSFYPVKHITTAEGGMLISRHRAVVDGIGKLRAFGVDRTHTERAIPGMYDVPDLGLNYRMSELQAALGRVQLARIDENLAHRRQSFAALAAGLAEVPGTRVLDSQGPDAQQSWYCLVVVLEGHLAARRNELVGRLNAAGIGTSVYYPQPVPRMTYYRTKYNVDPSTYPEATRISDSSLALPVGWHVGNDDVRYIVQTFASIAREMGAKERS